MLYVVASFMLGPFCVSEQKECDFCLTKYHILGAHSCNRHHHHVPLDSRHILIGACSQLIRIHSNGKERNAYARPKCSNFHTNRARKKIIASENTINFAHWIHWPRLTDHLQLYVGTHLLFLLLPFCLNLPSVPPHTAPLTLMEHEISSAAYFFVVFFPNQRQIVWTMCFWKCCQTLTFNELSWSSRYIKLITTTAKKWCGKTERHKTVRKVTNKIKFSGINGCCCCEFLHK